MILGPLQTRRRLQRQAFHEVLYNELLPGNGCSTSVATTRGKRDGLGVPLRRQSKSKGPSRSVRAPLVPLAPDRARNPQPWQPNSADGCEGTKHPAKLQALGFSPGISTVCNQTGDREPPNTAHFVEEAQRSATYASLRALQIRAAVNSGSLGGSAPSSRPRTVETCCTSSPPFSRNASPVGLGFTQPAIVTTLEMAALPVLLGLGTWLTPHDLANFAASTPALWRHQEELGTWALRQVYQVDIDELRFIRQRSAWHREELSALRALLFATRQRWAQCRARRRGVAAGLQHSVVIKEGSALTWGAATSGQLGRGSPAERFHSVPTPVPLHVPVRMVACGGEHSLLVTSGGDVWGFGRNSDGQLGVGSDHDAMRPQRMDVSGAVQAACGADHSLILTEDGSIWACGRGTEGQLGIELSELDRALSPLCAVSQGACHVAAGADHSVYLDSYGRAFAFGENCKGQLGIGTCESVSSPAMVAVPAGTMVVDVDCGGTHTLLLTDDLRVLGCGGNEKGQLGLGSKRDRLVPEPVVLHPTRPSRADRISCGFSHSVVLWHGSVWVLGGQAPKDVGEALRPRLGPVPRRLRGPLERLHVTDVGAGGGHGLCICADAVFSFTVGDTNETSTPVVQPVSV